jgi:hypothetical protein
LHSQNQTSVAGSGQIARGVHEGVRQAGRGIPQDINIAGDRLKRDLVDVL